MKRRVFVTGALGALSGGAFAQGGGSSEAEAARSSRVKGFFKDYCERTGQCVLVEGNPMDAYYTDSPAAFASMEGFAKAFRYSVSSQKGVVILRKTYEDALDFPCFSHKELQKALLALHALINKHYSEDDLKKEFNAKHPQLVARLLQGPVRLSEMSEAEAQGIQRILLSILSSHYFEILGAQKPIHHFHKLQLKQSTVNTVHGYFAHSSTTEDPFYRALLVRSVTNSRGEVRHQEPPKFVNVKPILIADTLRGVIDALRQRAPKVKITFPEEVADRPVFAASLSNRPVSEVLQGLAVLEDLRLKQTPERAQFSLPEQVTVSHLGDFRPAIYATLPVPLLRYCGFSKPDTTAPRPSIPGFTPPPSLIYRHAEDLIDGCHSVLNKIYQRLEKKETVPVDSLTNREACAALLLLLSAQLLSSLGSVGRPLFRETFPTSNQAIFLKAAVAGPGSLMMSAHAETPGIATTLRIGFGWPALP